ncbi:hypothetical protein K491DRAFT_685308 [Lophiostoma macrostomum CBS 122681]|uniref:Uncharacterized protein n=1 Tax=Lophiostoma macrostomum CBS 122681 TaxID=1314788 RepID=A0A6A6SJX9_9PLEO|nr:hypothetical protein K491DRAFT_685308 [Lophiostoma macrostomum CBS 122681]
MKLAVLFSSALFASPQRCTPPNPSTPKPLAEQSDNSPYSDKSKKSARSVSRKLFTKLHLRRDSGQEVQDAQAAYYSPDLEAARVLAKSTQSHLDVKAKPEVETSSTPEATVISPVPRRRFPIGRKNKKTVGDGQSNGPLNPEEARAQALAFVSTTAHVNNKSTRPRHRDLSQFYPPPSSSFGTSQSPCPTTFHRTITQASLDSSLLEAPESDCDTDRIRTDDTAEQCCCCARTSYNNREQPSSHVAGEELHKANEEFAFFDGTHFPTPPRQVNGRDFIRGIDFNSDKAIYAKRLNETARLQRDCRLALEKVIMDAVSGDRHAIQLIQWLVKSKDLSFDTRSIRSHGALRFHKADMDAGAWLITHRAFTFIKVYQIYHPKVLELHRGEEFTKEWLHQAPPPTEGELEDLDTILTQLLFAQDPRDLIPPPLFELFLADLVAQDTLPASLAAEIQDSQMAAQELGAPPACPQPPSTPWHPFPVRDTPQRRQALHSLVEAVAYRLRDWNGVLYAPDPLTILQRHWAALSIARRDGRDRVPAHLQPYVRDFSSGEVRHMRRGLLVARLRTQVDDGTMPFRVFRVARDALAYVSEGAIEMRDALRVQILHPQNDEGCGDVRAEERVFSGLVAGALRFEHEEEMRTRWEEERVAFAVLGGEEERVRVEGMSWRACVRRCVRVLFGRKYFAAVADRFICELDGGTVCDVIKLYDAKLVCLI